MSAQFSPYAQPSGAAGAWASENSEAGSHDDLTWSDFGPPARSMSYNGDGGGTQGTQQLQYLAVGEGQSFERRDTSLSDVYGQPFGTPVANMTGSMHGLEGQDGTVAGSIAPSVEAWQQQQQQQQLLPHDPVHYGSWQYDKAGGNQHVWPDEQRQQMATTRAPSDPYYSA